MFHIWHVIRISSKDFTRKQVQEIQDQIDGYDCLMHEELITKKKYDIKIEN